MATVFDNHLPLLDTDCDRYSPLSSPRDCPSLSESFASSFEMNDRRPSIASSQLTESPTWFSGRSSGAVTPTTPVTAMGAMLDHRKMHQTPDTAFGYPRPTDVNDLFWETDQHLPMSTGSYMHPMTEAELSYGMPAYTMAFSNPPMTRGMLDIHEPEDSLSWSRQLSSPQTVAPHATLSMLASSPPSRYEPCTPLRSNLHSSSILGSSPIGLVSPIVLPSQHEADEPKYDDPEWAMLTSEMRCRRPHDRISRRPYERKRIGGSFKPKPVNSSNKTGSGIDCEVVIAQNEFACSYPGCIDKQTGKQKRFKRQEHKKRHEKTVHEKNDHGLYKCWVGGCKTAPFTRTDNLKSHLKNTHGKRSPNQRNRYVASQDKNSVHYDPDWVGELTEDGYPVR